MEPGLSHLLEFAVQSGASLAGLVNIASLQAAGALPPGWQRRQPFAVRSVLVLALAHPPELPALDWWGGPGGTEGNRRLIRVVQATLAWAHQQHRVQGRDIPYGLDSGGIRLKDAAVAAGLGHIGRNNLLLTPQYGPSVRLRAMALDVEVETAPPVATASAGVHTRTRTEHNPCAGCPAPCLPACPQNAFSSGCYARDRCQVQMAWDEAHPVSPHTPAPRRPQGAAKRPLVAYCRACEQACLAAGRWRRDQGLAQE